MTEAVSPRLHTSTSSVYSALFTVNSLLLVLAVTVPGACLLLVQGRM
ncbi:hypothetical protein I5Q83_04275 [Enterocloster clostridioformis]|nr:hypothetical protein [Enterocloster clostridioformis]QQR01596.1 hypothetical protein I5Q83_04275 [Enterocloster clostridioformis]